MDRMLWPGTLLPGVCHDILSAAGQTSTNWFAGDRFRSCTPGLITLATHGTGILIGSLVEGPIVDDVAIPDHHDRRRTWLVRAGTASVVLPALLLFRDRARARTAGRDRRRPRQRPRLPERRCPHPGPGRTPHHDL